MQQNKQNKLEVRDIYAAFSAKHLAMGRAASMDAMAGSFAAAAWNSD